jgi:hypothetical protein
MRIGEYRTLGIPALRQLSGRSCNGKPGRSRSSTPARGARLAFSSADSVRGPRLGLSRSGELRCTAPRGRTGRGPVVRLVAAMDLYQLVAVPVIR